LVSWLLIEIQKTITLRPSNLLSTQAIWFQELNHLLIRCSKEDFSLIQILIDIDSERITNKFQSTVLTELEFNLSLEMVLLLSMATMVVLLTTSQTLISKVPKKIHQRLGLSTQYLVRSLDITTLIQTPIMSNQEPFGRKSLLRLIESTSSKT
jgi:hypothetical protein